MLLSVTMRDFGKHSRIVRISESMMSGDNSRTLFAQRIDGLSMGSTIDTGNIFDVVDWRTGWGDHPYNEGGRHIAIPATISISKTKISSIPTVKIVLSVPLLLVARIPKMASAINTISAKNPKGVLTALMISTHVPLDSDGP
jgi:hypothetical protein